MQVLLCLHLLTCHMYLSMFLMVVTCLCLVVGAFVVGSHGHKDIRLVCYVDHMFLYSSVHFVL